MNKKHLLVYYDRINKEYTSVTPRDWSRQNKNHFKKYKFKNSKDSPRDAEIEKYLKNSYGFVEFTYDEVVVLCNFDTKIKSF
jgi:hypothetical protein